VPVVNVEEMDHPAHLVSEVLMELWDLLVSPEELVKLVLPDFLEHLEPRETWVLLVTRVAMVLPVLGVTQEYLECLESLVRWDRRVKTEATEKREAPACPELRVLQVSLVPEASLV